LRKKATAPVRSAWSSSSLPAWALKKMTGILGLIFYCPLVQGHWFAVHSSPFTAGGL
jgi:hypothetical protein